MIRLAIAAAVAVFGCAAPSWSAGVPRTPDGRADLTGAWTNASVTKLTRPSRLKDLVVSPAEAARIAAADPLVRALDADAQPSDPEDNLLADGNSGQGYNAYWMTPGRTLGRVRGQFRTSWIVDPPDGQLPLSDAGRALAQTIPRERKPTAAEGPEALTPWDRCLISSRGAGGPGMLNTIYNSNYQIVQTPGSVVIVVEQVHDARVVPLFRDRAAAMAGHGRIPRWLGDSVGWWEGDTLVVETVGVTAEQGAFGPLYLSPTGRVTERLTRVAEGEILYEFAVEDPVYYRQAWRAEMTLSPASGQVYEFACHEGNYAMSGVLGAARAEERSAPAGR